MHPEELAEPLASLAHADKARLLRELFQRSDKRAAAARFALSALGQADALDRDVQAMLGAALDDWRPELGQMAREHFRRWIPAEQRAFLDAVGPTKAQRWRLRADE
jgi:hypothetical protein